MILFLLFLFLNDAVATTYSVFNYLNTSNLVPDSDCPHLYYGQYCEVPYCYHQNGLLIQRSEHDFYCNCTNEYTSGAHCELVECHDGVLSNSTFQCECATTVFGDHCEWTIPQIIECALKWLMVFLIFFLILTVLPDSGDKKDGNTADARSTARPDRESRTPSAPEIRIVERVVIQERSDAPPTYDAAVKCTDPPKYTAA
uniref:EGF-like domain-containing protein n=1 Tax=Panagrellus redivivus TaxID=6233 RepID=A0A7E4VAW6_PANRE